MKRLISVTMFSGLLTLLRIGSGFIVAKVVAIQTGPSGMAMLGQLQSMITALNGIVAAPVGNGLVRYTAEHDASGFGACQPWWRACTRWLQFILLLTIPVVCFGAKSLATLLFGEQKYAWVIVFVGLALPLSALNTLLASVINGRQQYRRFIGLNTVSVIIATAFMLALAYTRQLDGALLAAAMFSGISGVVMLLGAMRQPWFRLRLWFGSVDKEHFRGVGSYVAMAVVSAVCAPVSLVLVRNILISRIGWTEAGQWQAVYKISEVYLGVITMALSTYYLPRLSTISGFQAIRTEILSVSRVVMPVVSILAIGIYVLRDVAIDLLFTEQFRPARDLFAIQLIGDVVKILSWLFAFPMLSRGAAKWFIGTEILFGISFPVLTWFFVSEYGVAGANLAYATNYCLYFAFVYGALKYFAK